MGDRGAIVADAPTAIVTVDIDGRVVQMNASAERLLGVDAHSALGRPLDEAAIPSDLRSAYWSSLLGIASGRIALDEPAQLSTRVLGPDDNEVGADVTVARTRVEPLEVTAYVTAESGDRSERDHARRALDTCTQLTQTAGWEFDLDTGQAIRTPRLLSLLGVDGDTGTSPLDVEKIPFAHDEDRMRFADLHDDLFGHPERYTEELSRVTVRLALPDNSTRTVLVSWQTQTDSSGRPRWLVGAVQDITAMRSTEQEIEALHAVSRAIGEWEDEKGIVGLLEPVGLALEAANTAMWAERDGSGELWCRWFWSRPGFDAADMEAACRRVPLKAGSGATGRAFASREATVTAPTLESPYGQAAIDAGIRTVVAFPALYEGEPLAVLTVGYEHARQVDQSLLLTFETIGHAVGRFLHDRRGELGPQPLSTRELQVLRLAAEGQTGPEIARRLSLSPATVKTHFNNLYAKLGVADRAAAVAQAFRLGLLS